MFITFHRVFCMIFVTIFMISMFITFHRRFRYVFKEFPTEFRLKLWRRCVSQGSWPPFCTVASAPFASRNVSMPPFMQFHRGFRDVFTTCSLRFRFEFELTCVSQVISPQAGPWEKDGRKLLHPKKKLRYFFSKKLGKFWGTVRAPPWHDSNTSKQRHFRPSRVVSAWNPLKPCRKSAKKCGKPRQKTS